MSFTSAFNQIIVLFMLLLTGFAARKLGIVEASFSKNLSKLLFYIIIPATIINAMTHPFSVKTLIDSGWMVLVGIGIMIFSYLASAIIAKLLKADPLSRNIYQFAVIFPNFGFMGYPVVEAVFGEEGVFYAVVFNIANYIMVNSLGIMLIKRGTSHRIRTDFKNLINPPIAAVAAGMMIFLFSKSFFALS